jgi:hypothetical protein
MWHAASLQNFTKRTFGMTNQSPTLTPTRYRIFLEELAVDGIASRAFSAAGLDPSSTYKRRRENPEFAEAWEAAISRAGERLEAEAQRRAMVGVAKRLFHQGQPVYEMRTVIDEDGTPVRDEHGGEVRELVRDASGQPVQVVEYVASDSLLTTLLKANLPHKYRDNASVEMTGANGGPVRIELSDHEKASRIAFLLQKGLMEARKGPPADDQVATYTEVPDEEDDLL